MDKYIINLDKVNKFIFDEPFITTEIVETYELDDMDGVSDEIKMTSKQSHEIRNNSCDMMQLKMGFINQFIAPFIDGSDDIPETLVNTMLEYGYLSKKD